MTNKYIIVPLLIIVSLAVIIQFMNFQDLTTANYNDQYQTNTGVNVGSSEQLDVLGLNNQTMTVTLLAGFIALFAGICATGIIAGLNISVFGSTVQISERSQKIIFNILLYGGLWGIFSSLAMLGMNGIGLNSIPIFGILFYGLLSLFYILGISKEINSPSPQ